MQWAERRAHEPENPEGIRTSTSFFIMDTIDCHVKQSCMKICMHPCQLGGGNWDGFSLRR